MERNPFDLHQTVQEALREHPSVWQAFHKLKTGCVGCPLDRFCTLKDVADAYEIDPRLLLDELEAVVMKRQPAMRSKS